jgi:hypothetical protein
MVNIMDKQVYTFAVKNTLNEIRNVCPEITSTFMFKEGGDIIAGDDATSEKVMTHAVNSFDTIFEKADSIGGIEDITIEGSKGKLNVTRVREDYLVTVANDKADPKFMKAVTHVLIPTVLKLIEKINPTPLTSNLPPFHKTSKFQTVEETDESTEEMNEETKFEEFEEPEETVKPQIEPEIKLEASVPEPPVNQLIVENLGGLLVPSDTVRIDNEIIEQWASLYDGAKIGEIEIATFDGKTTRCKVKPIKDSKYEGKGIIQMPEKVQLALEIKKGELVKARPIIDSGE